MTAVVGRVVTECAEGEGVLVDVVRVTDQRGDEVAGANVVQQITEEMTAERIVAKVLNHASAVGVGASPQQVVRRRLWKARLQQGLDRGIPDRIDIRFVGEYRITLCAPRHPQPREDDRRHDQQPGQTPGHRKARNCRATNSGNWSTRSGSLKEAK